MMRKFIAMFATFAFAMAAFATPASAQRYRHHDRGYDRDRGGYEYYHRDDCYDRYGRDRCYNRHDDDDDDAIAAGVIGLVLGAVVATAIANSNNRDDGYYSDRDRYGDRYDPRYDGGYNDRGYAPPPPPPPQCTRRERQWDRYANRYVMVDVPC